jgi:hypothetical protein
MAVTIGVAIDPSKAQAGLAQLEDGFQGVAQTADAAGDKAARAFDLDAAMQDLISALHQVSDRIDDIQNEANESGNSLDKMGNKGEKASDGLAAKMTGLNSAFDLAKDAIEGIVNGLAVLAEDGNAGAVELQTAFSALRDELLQIADDPRLVNMLTTVADVLRQDIIPAVSAAASTTLGWVESAYSGLARLITWAGETLGVLEEGTYELLKADQERAAEAIKAYDRSARSVRKEKDAKKEVFDLTKEMAKLDQSKADAGKQQALEQLRSLEETQDVIEGIRDSLKDQNKTTEEQKKLFEDLVAAERKAEDFRKKAADDEEARRQKQRDWIAERERLEIESRQRIVEAEVQMHLGILRAADEAEKRQREMLEKNAAAQGVVGEAKKKSNDDREILKQLANEREQFARMQKQAELGLSDKEARGNQQVRLAGKAARRGAGDDLRDFRAGAGRFDEDVAAAPDNRADMQNEIGRAQNNIADKVLADARKAAEKAAQQQGGDVQSRLNAIRDIHGILEKMAQADGNNERDKAEFDARIRALEAFYAAAIRNGQQRRGQRNGA